MLSVLLAYKKNKHITCFNIFKKNRKVKVKEIIEITILSYFHFYKYNLTENHFYKS